jgi:hypothetical protein
VSDFSSLLALGAGQVRIQCFFGMSGTFALVFVGLPAQSATHVILRENRYDYPDMLLYSGHDIKEYEKVYCKAGGTLRGM